uniref:Ubiquitin-like protease family profile domain-containing protein n=1 Tax=Nelumbo nucifera TaxID=4432 RepID=A0A822YZY8_NELNU|nr:TPA_asm: hypothetical protein HUJ06_008711 [Nelumbo nucifera]
MGALTTNRKRGDGYFSLSYPSSSPYTPDSECRDDLHISKKPRISSMRLSPDRPLSSTSLVTLASRIKQYPQLSQGFRREVHAPCRKPKFGLHSTSSGREFSIVGGRDSTNQESIDEMGGFLSRGLEKAKSNAMDFLQHLRKDKEVLILEPECSKDITSEDSRIEELEILDNGRGRRSVGSDLLPRETSGDVFLRDAYAKLPSYKLQQSSSAVSNMTNLTPKVDEAEKMEPLVVSHGVEELGELPHKKLHKSAEKRNSRLSFLGFEIQLNEKKLAALSLLRLPKKSEDIPQEPFLPLTEEEEAEIDRAFSPSNRRKVLVTHENSNIQITGEILQCLGPGAWLNDEVINMYLELLKEREKREPKKFLKCHFFNTFFYKKIFVPIHKEIHWCLAVINKKDEKFQYLDSLKGTDSQVLKVLARYYVDEVNDKSGEGIDVSSWKHEYVDDLPKQENGWDCGVFMIKYADFYSRDLGLCFKQEHMAYFRRRTAKEILWLKAE